MAAENRPEFPSTSEAVLKRILSDSTVEGIILINNEGQPQYTSLDNNITFSIASKLFSFTNIARSTIRDIDPTDNLLTLRLRTREKEIMVVAPEDGVYAIAIQKIQSKIPIKQNSDNEDNDD
ncbi:unnamed protein product [Adineta ricciae]|uniref:Roadblock/LAMTOR2 domain-containing protein n=1 Tax=Adineta ricciae TaxID=249248 RepID=A0A815Q028_ADIRI|nr:unnamed protein product [Adineta ricciae]